jgi:hypothetical protein
MNHYKTRFEIQKVSCHENVCWVVVIKIRNFLDSLGSSGSWLMPLHLNMMLTQAFNYYRIADNQQGVILSVMN